MNASEERAHALHARAARWRAAGMIDASAEGRVKAELPQPWRVNSIPLQVVFFVLTAIGVGATYGMLNLLHVPFEDVVIGVIAIVASEALVRRGWFRTGVEAALLISGLISLITALPSSGEPEALLVIAAAFVIAAARLRHALFALVAIILIMVWSEVRFDIGLVVALALAAVAALSLVRRIVRPSTEATLTLVVLVLPIAGRFAADTQWRPMTIALMAAYGAFALLLGIVRRNHALLFASIIAIAIAAIDVSQYMRLVAEAKLAIAGTILLGTAFAIHRLLRDRTRGFVLHDELLPPGDDTLELAATIAMQPGVDAPAPEREGGGGFGGAGASGDY